EGRFDLVVANPPYIPTGRLAALPYEVSGFEPQLALDGGIDGLDVFRRIAPWAHAFLAEGGHLVVELYEDCLDAARGIALEAGFSSARSVKDLAGRDRVLVASKEGNSA
ncbi:MAG: peptide chain release factor N(5)-glutamine methyltransferase, partial [Coriobacteriaceae bacterium]|nr:peptide chain release factor N(5)-glutamine methyltransferase [Coriobacteriaceae bacterium]